MQIFDKIKLLSRPSFIPPLFCGSACVFTMAANTALYYTEYSPHTRFYVPAQRTGSIEVVAWAFCAFRLNIKNISNTDCSLNGNGSGKGIAGLRFPPMAVQSKTDISRLIRRHDQTDHNTLADIWPENRRCRIAVRFRIKHLGDYGDSLQSD